MKNHIKKFSFLLLMLVAGTFLMAQIRSFQSLSQELQTLEKQLVPDKRVAILEIEIKDTLQPTVVVSGETDLPDAKAEILRFLTSKKVSFVDSIRLLPDAVVGEKTWALATLSVSNLRTLPDHASELASQVMMGTPLKVLDQHENWLRVQTPEYYIGWMDSGGLQRITPTEVDTWKKSIRYLYDKLSGYAYDVPGKRGKIVSDLVLGDLFEVEDIIKGNLKIKFPDGRVGFVKKSDCITFEEWTNQGITRQSILATARQMMGFPYLWGGTSTKGIDCSGFVKVVYYAQGVIVARDASQQARYGEAIDFTNLKNLQPADLLFFGKSAQRISHVGIYLEKGDFIHASVKVYISSLVPGNPKHDPKRNFVAARRIPGSVDSEGVVSVKKHPWYNVKP